MLNDCDFTEFLNDFDVVENALDMRCLRRWNGRDLRIEENLSEHTHLVLACAVKLYDELTKKEKSKFNFEAIVRLSMLHDSLELLRGDILSVTKDKIPGLRKHVDDEEYKFMASKINCKMNDFDLNLVRCADLMACYKFIEKCMEYPSNDFTKQVYSTCKQKFDDSLDFLYNLLERKNEVTNVQSHFEKGYIADAGCDVIIDRKMTFLPMTTTTIGLNVKVTPKEGYCSYLCARTSAANKGLFVAMCPIDPNYDGEVLAIVHNISNQVITYNPGQAFCQVVTMPLACEYDATNIRTKIKHPGKRTSGNLGSTGGTNGNIR